jgi:hypothetical protein
MSHWAELDDNNIVIRVVVCDNDDPNGDEGYQWLLDNLGGRWIQTSYNANFRGTFAAVGGRYDVTEDRFYNPLSNPKQRPAHLAPPFSVVPENGTTIYTFGDEQ